jgi:hypothetical protein
MLIGQGLRLVGVGVILGVSGGAAVSRALSSLLFGLSPFDPIAGYEGHLNVLQAYLEPWRKLLPEEIRRKQPIPAVSPPTPRAVVWWLLEDKEKLKGEQRAFIGELLEKSPITKAACELIWDFRRMIKTRDGKKPKDWLGKAEQSRISELARKPGLTNLSSCQSRLSK